MGETATASGQTVAYVSDGTTIRAHLERPCGSPPDTGWPGVVVLHEWWGLNDHIKGIAKRLAAGGFVAMAPDLYARQGATVTKDPEEAARLMEGLSAQWVLRDLNAATRFFKGVPGVDGLRLGIMGFCMGGTLALNQVTHNSEFKAAVIFYGKVPPAETIPYLLCPVLYHEAEQDGWVTRAEVERLRQGLRQHGKPGEVFTYAGRQHAFFNDTRQEVYDQAAAQSAWQRTLDFFARHLR
jgi:carboxymethylenebutenolidase